MRNIAETWSLRFGRDVVPRRRGARDTMRRTFRNRITAGLALVALMFVTAACGGATPTPQTSQTTQGTVNSPPPGPGDAAICQVISRAETSYAAAQWTIWRAQMAQIGALAGSASYVPIKADAQALKTIYTTPSSTTTTTTKPKSKSKIRVREFNPAGLTGLYAYAGLRNTCSKIFH